MKLRYRQQVALCLTAQTLLLSIPTAAQIVPDATLGVNSLVTPNGNTFTIDGGNRAGGNLFHSFQEFSLPTGKEAWFNNSVDVQNIFSRITGSNISNIDGLIRANGTANLFLINPNGIIFGPNARLNIGGSFFGTTANSIRFADGVEFSASNPQTAPLLTVSVPIGLQFGQNSGGITVQGSGHSINDSSDLIPTDPSQNPIGLQVRTGNTLALIGGKVNFSGGIAAVEGGGHLEVSSVSEGQVRLNPIGQGWQGDYSEVSQFNDIHLASQSLIHPNGSNSSIHIQGRNISLTEGSAALLSNLGTQPSGGITIHATETLKLTGNTADGTWGSFIHADNLGTKQAGNLTVSAAQLSLQNGGRILSQTFSSAPGSNLTVNVIGSIDIDGAAPANPGNVSGIGSNTFSSANAGRSGYASGTLARTPKRRIAQSAILSHRQRTICRFHR